MFYFWDSGQRILQYVRKKRQKDKTVSLHRAGKETVFLWGRASDVSAEQEHFLICRVEFCRESIFHRRKKEVFIQKRQFR